MAAEHGYFLKDSQEWVPAYDRSSDWKQLVYPTMEQATAQAPGSFIEEKNSSLVWQYRGSVGPGSEMVADELARRLEPLLQPQRLEILHGHKIIEVRPAGVHKGAAARHWLARADWDFVLAAGDDATDEDLFTALPDAAYSLKIGPGPSQASRRLPDPPSLTRLLVDLTRSGREPNQSTT
jgi:trehalose 6-phosphate synthase/phosphatase